MLRNIYTSLFVSLLAMGLLSDSAPAQSTAGCPQTSDPVLYGTGTLDTGVEEKDGVVYVEESGVGKLTLSKAGANFQSVPLGITDVMVYGGAGDFNMDGYGDFVGGDLAGYTTIYENFSYFLFSPSDFESDPAFVGLPFFQPVAPSPMDRDSGGNYYMFLATGDFDGDGDLDALRANSTHMAAPSSVELWKNVTVPLPGMPIIFDSPYNPIASDTTPSQLGVTAWAGTNVAAVDYNGDRKLDLLIGSAETDGGSIRIFLNTCTSVASPAPPPALVQCADDPKFSYGGALIENMDLSSDGVSGELPVFVYEDFDGDGLRDLIAGSPQCCATASKRLQIWRGVNGGGVEATPSQSITFVGAATAVLAADFSLDGRPDLIVATDGNNYGAAGNIGGQSFYYENNRTATPFSDGPTTQLTAYDPVDRVDTDVGFVFNYDNDPQGTPDVVLADGNNSASYVLLANRVYDTYVECGEVISDVIDLGPLDDTEMVVTSARLSPTVTLNGGTITWYMSNEDPPNWVEAVDCGDSTGDICASFPKPVGRDVRWKAVLCSDSTNTQSPEITGIEANFDYTEATQFLRAGVVIYDGVAYVGTFSQPGDRGKLYAINTGLDQTYWEASEKLDAISDGNRNIFTVASDGTTPLEFRWTGNAAHDELLRQTLTASDAAQAQDVINWVRSPRFGVGNPGIQPTRLGGIELSTPAVINKPGWPVWYALAGSNDRAAVDAFMTQNSDRIPMVLFGAKDGMLHAIRNDPTDIYNVDNGKEMWAYVPGKVASRMVNDYSNSQSGTLTIGAYPDGAPSVADVKIGAQLATVAVVGSGNGGSGIAAMNITMTVEPMTSTVLGPQPLWHATPGDADAGRGYSKPVIARVDINGSERYIAIAATGMAPDNVTPPYTRGRIVAAYDIATGAELWKFKAACPVTSHLAVFETDEENASNQAPTVPLSVPKLDGFMDRLVFGDRCGYFYQLDPAKDLGGDWNDNTGLQGLTGEKIGEENGQSFWAMFSTRSRDELGADPADRERPIAGTIGARIDNSTRVVLFFGTGGMEEFDPTVPNGFYAVYADNGVVRSSLTSTCDGTSGICGKYYGGVVITTDQVILTRTEDRRIGTGVCDQGETAVLALQINPDGDGEFVEDFSTPVSGAAVGSMYGDAGAVYFATMSGEIVRVGNPRVTTAGADTAAGNTGGTGGGSEADTGSIQPLVLMGWRQIF